MIWYDDYNYEIKKYEKYGQDFKVSRFTSLTGIIEIDTDSICNTDPSNPIQFDAIQTAVNKLNNRELKMKKKMKKSKLFHWIWSDFRSYSENWTESIKIDFLYTYIIIF